MVNSRLEHTDEDIHIKCPYCENWEEQSIDLQRHHLKTFSILEWFETAGENPEINLMECLVCNEKFNQTWDYKGILKNSI